MKPVIENRVAIFLSHTLQIYLLAGSLLTCSLAHAQETAAPTGSGPAASGELTARYPSGSIQSAETANRALTEVDQQRSAIEQTYAAEQTQCYEKFFATNCLDAAKERRRVALAKIRTVEIEANAFIRGDRVVQRDQKLAEKRASEAANPPKPLAELPPKQVEQADVEKAKENQQRMASHEEKLKQKQQDAAGEAAKHAESAAAFEKKTQDALARQKDVAEKKAEKARRAAAKAAAATAASTGSTTAAPTAPASTTPTTAKP
jgi:colicin import membrane protein